MLLDGMLVYDSGLDDKTHMEPVEEVSEVLNDVTYVGLDGVPTDG